MKQPIITIVIPCLNEAKTITASVRDAKKYAKLHFKNRYELIVCDNGSTDGTLQLLNNINGIRLIGVPTRGYGAALHWGIMHAKSKYVLFADADLSYPFSNIKYFAQTLMKNPDLVLGSRISGKIEQGAMPPLHRYIGTPILTKLIRIIYAIETTDCNSGMRMVKKSFYKKLNMRKSGMEWASELLLKTALKKGVYIEVPIKFVKDKRNRKSHLATWSDGWRHLKTIILLKPKILIPLLFVMPGLAIYLYYSRGSFALIFLLLLNSFVLFLSLLALHLLEAVTENKNSVLSNALNSFSLVPLTMLFSLVVVLSIITVPPQHLGTKLLLVSFLAVISMWIFLIETIKTHLVNRLPDNLK